VWIYLLHSISFSPKILADHQYTVNGKKIEIAVKQIVSGINVRPSAAVANPESLQLYYKYRDLDFARAKL